MKLTEFAYILIYHCILSGVHGQFERMFKQDDVLHQPAGAGKILIQSELKIDVLYLPEDCTKKVIPGDTLIMDYQVEINGEIVEDSYFKEGDDEKPEGEDEKQEETNGKPKEENEKQEEDKKQEGEDGKQDGEDRKQEGEDGKQEGEDGKQEGEECKQEGEDGKQEGEECKQEGEPKAKRKLEQVEPLMVKTGRRMVIPGLENGVMGMCIGEKRKIKIPPHLAFGPKGIPGYVPENAEVTFIVELLYIEPKSWGEWYVELIWGACYISFLGGFIMLIVSQVKERRKERRKKVRKYVHCD